jgi:hypothetical protein
MKYPPGKFGGLRYTVKSKEGNDRHMMKENHGCLALKRTMNYLTILGRPPVLRE